MLGESVEIKLLPYDFCRNMRCLEFRVWLRFLWRLGGDGEYDRGVVNLWRLSFYLMVSIEMGNIFSFCVSVFCGD